jgi:hypothetical protein
MRKLPVVLTCRGRRALPRRANQLQISGRPAPDQEGRFAIVTNVGRGMRWTYWVAARIRERTNNPDTYGEVVWSWRPGADAKFALFVDEHASDGGKQAGPRGEYV